MNKATRILLIIGLLGTCLRIGTAFILGDEVEALPGIHDQISYHTLSIRLLQGHGFSFGQPWWPATRSGDPTAHWSYLYTFFLAIVYKIFGTHPLAARLLQGVFAGILLPWLSFRLTRRVFSTLDDAHGVSPQATTTALTAAVWAACYPYFLYYASALMTETFFMLGVLWILDTSLQIWETKYFDGSHKRRWIWIQLGLAIGLTALLRQAILVWVPFLCLWLIYTRRRPDKQSKQRWQIAGGLVLSGIVALTMVLPFTLYNYQRFGRFVFLNTNAGFAFYWANHPIHGDQFIPILDAGQPSYQELIPAELLELDEAALDQELLKEGLKFVAADPGRYLQLSFSRIPVYFQFWPSAESSLPSNLTRVFSFGLALPFMVLGTGLWIREAAKRRIPASPGNLLLLFALIYSGIHIFSWALIRYRLPVDAVMLIFAAYGLAWFLKILGIWPWIESKVSVENPLPGPIRSNTD